MNYANILSGRLAKSAEAFKSLAANEEKLATFGRIVSLIASAVNNGGRLYIGGNGGSAADAQHMATEFVCRFSKDRSPIPAEALTTDSSLITAIANDYGYERTFSRQLMAKMGANDVFMAISTSGASENIVQALKYCHDRDMSSILLTGKDGGRAAEYAGICLIADGEETSVIQELHLAIEHAICACVEEALGRS